MNAFANVTDAGAYGAPELQSRHPPERESIWHMGNGVTRLAWFRHVPTERPEGIVTMRSTIASTALANSAPSPSCRSSYRRRVSRTSSSASGRKTTRRVTLLPTTSGELRTRGPLFRAQRQFPLALVVGQTLPQRHRQVGAIAGGSLNSCASTLDSMA